MADPSLIKVASDERRRLFEEKPPAVQDVVVQVQRVLAELQPSQYESAVRRILASVDRIEADRQVDAALDALGDIRLYEDRPDRRATAAQFFADHYASLVEAKRVFADDLRRHDPRLYRALSAYLSTQGRKLSDVIPLRPVAIKRRRA